MSSTNLGKRTKQTWKQVTLNAMAGSILLAVPALAVASLALAPSLSERDGSHGSLLPFDAPTLTEAATTASGEKYITLSIKGNDLGDEAPVSSFETWEDADCKPLPAGV